MKNLEKNLLNQLHWPLMIKCQYQNAVFAKATCQRESPSRWQREQFFDRIQKHLSPFKISVWVVDRAWKSGQTYLGVCSSQSCLTAGRDLEKCLPATAHCICKLKLCTWREVKNVYEQSSSHPQLTIQTQSWRLPIIFTVWKEWWYSYRTRFSSIKTRGGR